MDATEKAIRQKLKDNFEHYASKCLKIRTKSGQVLPLELNSAQRYIHERVEQQRLETGKIRAIICKGRQMGCSSYIEGRFYWRVTHTRGLRAFILTHDSEATNNLFDMAKRYHEYCPEVVRPSIQASNAKELVFAGMDSGYKLGTAGNKSVGRSSTIQLLHASECAYYPHADEHAKGILQAVPNAEGTEIFIESTANGIGNYFHEQWQKAEAGDGEFIPIFVPWFWQEEYVFPAPIDFKPYDDELELMHNYGLSKNQLMWRRLKISEFSVGGMDGIKGFQTEYPCTPIDAFTDSGEDVFIPPSIVMHASKGQAEPVGPLLVGVDPARFGNDRTAIIYRRGRVAYNLRTYRKKDLMEIVGLVNNIIAEDKPAKVFIDIAGLGAGVYDRLMELGHKGIDVGVNAGTTPLDQAKFRNKRAEMYAIMKEWLQDFPCKIPDEHELHADLCGPRYKIDSNSRLLIESKEDMKSRGIRSSDVSDALSLTFFLPMSAIIEQKDKKYDDMAKSLYSQTNRLEQLKREAYR